MLASMNDGQLIKFQVAGGLAHGWRKFWGGGVFNFKTPSLIPPDNKKIDFRSTVGSPEETFFPVGTQMPDELIQYETLPGGTHFRMASDIRWRSEIE